MMEFIGFNPQVFQAAVETLLSMDAYHVLILTLGLLVAGGLGFIELIRYVKGGKRDERL